MIFVHRYHKKKLVCAFLELRFLWCASFLKHIFLYCIFSLAIISSLTSHYGLRDTNRRFLASTTRNYAGRHHFNLFSQFDTIVNLTFARFFFKSGTLTLIPICCRIQRVRFKSLFGLYELNRRGYGQDKNILTFY